MFLMTKKRVLSLSLSILLFLSMILSPFGNLILPSITIANAATSSRATISNIAINSYEDVVGVTITLNNAITLSSGTTISKITTQSGSSVGYNATCNCASGNTHAVPLNGQTGNFSYSLVSTSSTESGGTRTTTYNYKGYFKNDADYGSNGYQSINIWWQEKKTEPLTGYLQIEKKWVAKTSNNGQDNIKALIEKYPKAYNKNTQYRFRVFNSITGGNEIATITNKGITVTTYGKNNGYFTKDNNTLALNSSSSKTVYIQEDNLEVNGWATNTGRQAYKIESGKTTKINSTTIGNINVNVPVIMNIKSYKVDPNNNRIKVAGAEFKLYYSPTLTTSQMKNKITVNISNDKRTATSINNDTANILLMATGKTDSTGQVKWTTSSYAAISGWDYIKYNYNFRGPVGYYVIVETKAPTNYKITNKYIKEYDFMSESYATKAYSSENSFMYTSNSHNQTPNISDWDLINPNARSLKIEKSYTNPDMITMFPNIYKKSGAKYNIYYGGTSNDKVVATAITNNDGFGVITLKDYGKNLGLTVSSDNTSGSNTIISNISETMLNNWYVKEIQSASGFNLKTDISKKLSLSGSVTTFNVNSTDVLENDALTGSIHLTKYLSSSGINGSALNNRQLENASLNLYYCPIDQNTIKTGSTKYTYKDIKNYLSNNLVIGSETTHTTSNNKMYKIRGITASVNNIYFIGKFKVQDGKIKIDNINQPSINNKKIIPLKETDSNGHQYFSNLPLGSYCLIEERTPDYSGQSIIDFSETDHNIVVLGSANGKVTTVSENYFSLNDNNNIFDITFEIEEPDSQSVQLKINKKSTKPELNLSVKGAEFDVYYNENQNPNITFSHFEGMYAKYSINTGVKVATFTIDNNGIGKISYKINNTDFSKNIDETILYGKNGYYTIVESKLPENNVFGWNLDDNNEPIIYRTGKLSTETGSTKSYTLNAEDPPVSDPAAMMITKTVNNNQIPNMTEADLEAIRPLENTQFTLNYYLNAQELNEIANKDPDLTIVYKTTLINNKYQIRLSRTSDIISYTGNLNKYLVDGILEFPVGIYTIKETQASYGYSTANNTWKYNNTTYTGTNDYGLVFRVKNVYNNGAAKAYTYVYNDEQWSNTPIIDSSTSTSINFDKPNDFEELGSFKFNKKFDDDGDLRSTNNVKFNLYSIKQDKTLNVEEYIETNILFKTDGIYSNPSELINNQSFVENTLYNYNSPIECITDTNGDYESGNLPVGDYLLVETRCEANLGYAIHKPVVISITKDTCNDDYYNDPIINIKPRLITTEYDANTSIYDVENTSTLLIKNHMSNSTVTMKIVDEVEYEYLSANTSYTLKAFMMYIDSSDNKIKPVVINNKPVQAFKIFNTGNATNNIYNTVDGFVNVEFSDLNSSSVISATNSNKFIIYEYLFKDANTSTFSSDQINKLINNNTSENSIENAVIINNKFVGHYDAEDINQIGYFPQISTKAIGTVQNGNYKVTRILKETIENDDESDEVNYLEYIKFHDTLSYSGLMPNESYTIELKVKDYNDSNKILYENIYEFIPTNSTGTYHIKNITVNIDDTIDKVFVTENIYYNNVLIASHENLTQEQKDAQSVALARISTNLTSNSQLYDEIANSDQRPANYIRKARIPEDGYVSLTDTITYKNFIDNDVTFDITCEYRYADGPKVGKLVVDKNNNILRKIEENVTLSGSGTYSITIDNIDLSNFKGKNLRIVAYEIIRFHGTDRVIAKENDKTNAFQSLLFLGTTFKFSKLDNFGNAIRDAKLAIKSVTINTETNEETLNNYVTWTTGDNYSVIYNNDPNDPRNSSINNPIETIPFEITLPDGTYYLVEESSPIRYTKAEPVKFKIETDSNNETKMYIIDTNTSNSVNVLNKTITMIDNNLTRLPSAGGEGTTIYIVFGMLLMSCSVLYIYKKKRKI
jgi:LPXTG-motif cell wall-anchored protein